MLSKQLNEKIVRNLYREIPEFEKYSIEYMVDEEFLYGYLVMDCLGSFAKELVRQKASSELIDKCYSFVNHLCENDDKDIEEWLKVTFLESMVEKGEVLDVTRLKLKGKASIFFEEVIESPFWRR